MRKKLKCSMAWHACMPLTSPGLNLLVTSGGRQASDVETASKCREKFYKLPPHTAKLAILLT